MIDWRSLEIVAAIICRAKEAGQLNATEAEVLAKAVKLEATEAEQINATEADVVCARLKTCEITEVESLNATEAEVSNATEAFLEARGATRGL